MTLKERIESNQSLILFITSCWIEEAQNASSKMQTPNTKHLNMICELDTLWELRNFRTTLFSRSKPRISASRDKCQTFLNGSECHCKRWEVRSISDPTIATIVFVHITRFPAFLGS